MLKKDKMKRREFLKGVTATSGAVAIGITTGEVWAAPAVQTEEVASGNKGYRLTAHIRDYYASTRS